MLNPVPTASYKSQHHPYCLEGTRVAILESLMNWASDIQSPHIYWLYGIAGTGKSTIAQSFCKQLEERGFIVASFFCSRNATERSDILRIIPTIAESLARRDRFYSSIITRVLKRDPHVASYAISQQIKELFLEQSIHFQKHWVIVIDGLDECSNPGLIKQAIETLVDSAHFIPAHVFIASREEREISTKFQRNNYATQVALHEVERFIVQWDIHQYLKFKLTRIPGLTLPIDTVVDYLLEQSDKLFLYASTAVKYIEEGYNSEERVKRLMAQKELHGINKLYTEILNNADSRLEDADISVLQTLICLQDPLSILALNALLNVKSYHSLSAFRSVIHMPKDIRSNTTVQIFHASFPEFLGNPKKCPKRYHLDFRTKQNLHSNLALCCLNYLQKNLRRNPLQLELHSEISQLNKLQVPTYMDQNPGLKYACTFWIAHWIMGHSVNDAGQPHNLVLTEFMQRNVLIWVEHLILLQVPDIRGHVHRIFPYLEAQLLPYFSELCIFLSQSAEILSRWPLEIYNSAVLWTPAFSCLTTLHCFQKKLQAPPTIVDKYNSWGDCEQVITMGGVVTALAMFSDNLRIAVALRNQTLKIWNTSSSVGRTEHILKGHTGLIKAVAISPDNSRVISASVDLTVRTWHAGTGKAEHVLQHSNWVKTIAISSDSSKIVSGAYDGTIRIWIASTGEIEYLLHEHSDCVTAVAIFPHPSRVVSGSDDKSIRLWNMLNGKIDQVLQGHLGPVIAVATVAIFPNNSRVASMSYDNIIRVWNTSSGKVDHVLVGHTDAVQAVTIFPDCSKLASCSLDHTVRIWNATTGKVQHILRGHADGVIAVITFPDSSRIVSGSHDETIRIWNAYDGQEEQVLYGHAASVDTLVIFPNSSRIVSGSMDNSIRIWKISTGRIEHVLTGHYDHITTISVYPDCSRIVSGSNDKTIRIWSTSTGQVEHVIYTHYSRVLGLAISPDGSRLFSHSFDRRIWEWDVSKGTGHAVTIKMSHLSMDSALHQLAAQFRAFAFSENHDELLLLQYNQEFLHGCQSKHMNWIPPHQRDITCVASSDSLICFGHKSGKVTVIDMTFPHISEVAEPDNAYSFRKFKDRMKQLMQKI
ncbi:hypothetical protein GYMLUDRAFT_214597 [Collybiopsis luxurians FD-317 M1]|nr:hypothetical protein GYMLUDRAFT_214597 [Collybiopsis luxurians FD-317 M1]